MKKQRNTIVCAVLCSLLIVPAGSASKKNLLVEGACIAGGLVVLGVSVAARVSTGRKIAVLKKTGLMTCKNLQDVQIDRLTLSPKEKAILKKMIDRKTSPKNLMILKHFSNVGIALGSVATIVATAFGVNDLYKMRNKKEASSEYGGSGSKKKRKRKRKRKKKVVKTGNDDDDDDDVVFRLLDEQKLKENNEGLNFGSFDGDDSDDDEKESGEDQILPKEDNQVKEPGGVLDSDNGLVGELGDLNDVKGLQEGETKKDGKKEDKTTPTVAITVSDDDDDEFFDGSLVGKEDSVHCNHEIGGLCDGLAGFGDILFSVSDEKDEKLKKLGNIFFSGLE